MQRKERMICVYRGYGCSTFCNWVTLTQDIFRFFGFRNRDIAGSFGQRERSSRLPLNRMSVVSDWGAGALNFHWLASRGCHRSLEHQYCLRDRILRIATHTTISKPFCIESMKVKTETRAMKNELDTCRFGFPEPPVPFGISCLTVSLLEEVG